MSESADFVSFFPVVSSWLVQTAKRIVGSARVLAGCLGPLSSAVYVRILYQ